MRGPKENASFIRRFDAVRKAAMQMQIAQGVCWGLFVAGAAIVALAAADYFLEWPWSTRAAWLAAGLGLAAVVTVVAVLRPLLWWSRPQTAQELETLFPQLGQRVRTVVQFSGSDPQAISQQGVTPNLVTALEEETGNRAEPLDLQKLVPRQGAIVAAAVAVLPIVLLLAGLVLDWQWRLAIGRALLGNAPYTTIEVTPGDVTIDQGHGLALTVSLHGRLNRSVTLETHKADAPEGDRASLPLESESIQHRSPDGRRVEYSVAINEVVDPFDYRFLAGKLDSGTHHVAIRYPLGLAKFEATLTPPAYTGLPPKTVEGGDLNAIEDSEIRLALECDRDCNEAYLLVSDPPYKEKEGSEPVPPVRVALEPSPSGLVADLQLRKDKFYSIVASADEGGPLPENEYRIRIRKDRAPHVRFQDPPEAWEVNPIAEVPMQIRVDDDFGVAKAGIVFQIDNGEEHGLATKEYSTSVEPDVEGKIHLTTRAAVEELLCLEDFEVTETSAVTYYAYVEDNYPKKPNRTLTDLRFIEIRPFHRFFKIGGT